MSIEQNAWGIAERKQVLTACHDHPCILRDTLLTLSKEFDRCRDRGGSISVGRDGEDREAGVNTEQRAGFVKSFRFTT